MSVEIRRVGEITILDLHGAITVSKGTSELNDNVSDLLKSGQTKIVLNTQGVKLVDSQGIAEILKAHTSVTQQGGQLKITGLSPHLHDVLNTTKLILVFDIRENEQAALDSFT
ncbi:MAG: STAS domain-containing protein [Acidobacteriota bacterium]